MAAVLTFLKSILPTKKISAWILGLLGAALAFFMGVSNSDLKTEFCKSELVNLPAPVVAAPTPAPVEVKK